MLQIKTIIDDHNNHLGTFDRKVNDALAEGWELKRRDLVPRQSGFILYAELEKDDEEEDDRLCETCAHQFKEPQEQPCIECDGDCSHWEPKNLEKPQKAEEPEEEEICEACMIRYDDEPKEEEVEKSCSNCKHKRLTLVSYPCSECKGLCTIYSKWEPKEEKSCGNCKYKGLDEYDEPCICCKGMTTNYSNWEPIAESEGKK
jgi:hypothetical protein